MDGKAITISVTLYEDELAALERWSEEEARSKSNMVRRLIIQETRRRADAEANA